MDLITGLKSALDAMNETTGLVLTNERLVVGVSGGPDSLALLHILRQTISPSNLIVAHLDHQLRPASAADATFVRHSAEGWGLSFYGKAIDVTRLAGDTQQSLEEAGRQARYQFLADVARGTDAVAIVTGHNADDQVETVLMHILRGSGLAGLRGMLPTSRLPEDPEIWLLRPLLFANRADIDSYCRDHGLQPRIDVSNSDTTYFRNRLRHELLPLLETYNPQIAERLQHLATVVSADYDMLRAISGKAYTELVMNSGSGWLMLDRAEWSLLPLSLRRSTLRAALEQLVPEQRDVGFATIEAARKASEVARSGQQAHLPGGVVLFVTADRLLLTVHSDFPDTLFPQVPGRDPLALPVPGTVELEGGWTLSAELVNAKTPVQDWAQQDTWTANLTLDSTERLVVRGRMPGETIRPLGLNGHSATLKELMIDRKVPAPLRARWPVVANSDHAIWVAGHTIDHHHRVTPESTTIVRLRCQQPH